MDETTPSSTIKKAPAPWTCKAQIYALYFYSRSGGGGTADAQATLRASTVAYAPLERNSFFASPEAGQLVGGIGSIMVIRYTETPVGPYDELLVIPGSYTYPTSEQQLKTNARISRIYVSQKDTLYNGRYNWNIPKHMARFDWTDLPNNTTQVQVYPHEADATEQSPVATPLFRASFRTVPYVPAFPLSTAWAKYVGVDTAIVQPPLPQGVASEEEVVVVGTARWCKSCMRLSSSRSHLCWVDLRQRGDGESDGEKGDVGFENFWPGLGRTHLGVRMDDAVIEVPEGEYWTVPMVRPRL